MTTRSTVHSAGVRGVISEARASGAEAVAGVREVKDNVATAIDQSLKKRPHTTLVLAVGVGFVLGAIWAS